MVGLDVYTRYTLTFTVTYRDFSEIDQVLRVPQDTVPAVIYCTLSSFWPYLPSALLYCAVCPCFQLPVEIET